MRVFLDTNVILEFFIEREDVRTAAQLFNRLKDEKAEMYMSVGSFYTMLFLIDKYLRKELGLTGEVRIAILRHQPNSKALLDDNGSQLLSEIREDVDSRIVKLNKLKQSTLSKYQQAFRRLGLTEENAYLYMQGHCVYDLVSRIGSSLTGDSAGFKAQVLDKTLQVGGYYEIDRLVSDIRKIYP